MNRTAGKENKNDRDAPNHKAAIGREKTTEGRNTEIADTQELYSRDPVSDKLLQFRHEHAH